MNKQDIPILRVEVPKSLARLETCNPRDADLIAVPYRDHPVVAACGLDDLAWSLTSGLHVVTRDDVRGFLELLSKCLDREVGG